jgi:hypothetical protein
MASQQVKTCVDCGQNLPAKKDHFRQRKDGTLDVRCLLCRRDKLQGRKKQALARSLTDIESGAVSTFMGAARGGGENIPHSCEVLERLMEYFGGVSGFTSLLVKQYFDSPPGGATRTKMLDSILRLVVKNTDQGGAKKPLGQWSDDELETELDGRLRALAAQFQGKIVDGTIKTEKADGASAPAVGIEDKRLPGSAAQRNPGRARRPKNRGAKALPADSAPGGNAQVQGE